MYVLSDSMFFLGLLVGVYGLRLEAFGVWILIPLLLTYGMRFWLLCFLLFLFYVQSCPRPCFAFLDIHLFIVPSYSAPSTNLPHHHLSPSFLSIKLPTFTLIAVTYDEITERVQQRRSISTPFLVLSMVFRPRRR